MASLGPNGYGKSRVRVSKLARLADRHEFVELAVDTRLEGDFEAAHVDGDNRAILPTDTQRNTVYALAAQRHLDPIEEFAAALAQRFLASAPAVERAIVQIERRRWMRVHSGATLAPHAFIGGGDELRTAKVAATRAGREFTAGLSGLALLKTAGSRFEGFLRDEYTTLLETSDRILATTVTARWRYSAELAAFDSVWSSVRESLIEAFVEHDSASVQHTLFAMGQRALERHATIREIHLALPNLHHLPVDLERLGIASHGQVFQPSSEPHGVIEATVRR